MVAMQKERLRLLTIAEQGELQAVVKASSERCGSGEAGDGRAGGGQRGDVRGGGTSGGLSERWSGHLSGTAVQAGWAGRTRDRGRAWAVADLRRSGSGRRSWRPPSGHRIGQADGTATWSLDAGTDGAPRGAAARGGDDDPGGCCDDAGSVRISGRGRRCPTGTAQRKRKSGVVRVVVDLQTEEKEGAIDHGVPGEAEAAKCRSGARTRLGPLSGDLPSPGGGCGARSASPACRAHEYVRGGTRQAADAAPSRHRARSAPRA